MKKYLRFGDVPQNCKSVNFAKLSFDEKEEFSRLLKAYGPDEAFNYISADCFENGLSVFELDRDGLPVLSNFSLCKDLLARLNEPAYELTGTQVGIGCDGEPLISDVKVLKKRRLKPETLQQVIFKALLRNFRFVVPDHTGEEAFKTIFIYSQQPYYINLVTGEHSVERVNGKDWARIENNNVIIYNGYIFSQPYADFWPATAHPSVADMGV